ncbi:MAG: carboxymuconolactone decarboxylase family protein [Myxococcales bacterium]|nr:carboxymuconolactone decarboxylase family protein [Myxococcales bacterium]
MTNPNDATPSEHYERFRAAYPAIADAHAALGQAIRAEGPLDERSVALVKLALAIGAQLEGGVHAHTRRAVAAGIERQAIEHVALLAASTLGFPRAMAAYAWVCDTLDRADE